MISQEIVITVTEDKPRVRRDTVSQLQRWQAQTRATLQTQPGSPKYPIRWTSERQRKFVMAKLRREGNLPYRRTGKLVAQWAVDVDIDQITRRERFFIALLNFLAKVTAATAPTPPASDVIVRIANPSPVEQYVTGIHQQGFHKDTGWYQSGVVLDTAVQQVEGILTDL
jgi:hypothetical protein